MRLLYDKGLFDEYIDGKAHQVLKDYLLIEVNERCRPESEEVNDIVQ